MSEPLLVTRLLFFLDCRHEEHVVLLAALARLIVVNAKLPGVLPLYASSPVVFMLLACMFYLQGAMLYML